MAFGVFVYVYGRRPYGRIERFAGSCVCTTFSHVWFLPIVPRDSYVRTDAEPGVESKEVPIGMHLGSILAAYARVWGLIWFVACVIALAQGAREFVLSTSIWVDFGLLLSVVLWGFLLAGRISPQTAAHRLVYAKFAGAPVDVARYSRAQTHDLRELLERVLLDEGRGQSFAYRDGADPRERWLEIAIHDDVRNATYLEAALTRTRLERRWRPNERKTLAQAHERIWRKLTA